MLTRLTAWPGSNLQRSPQGGAYYHLPPSLFAETNLLSQDSQARKCQGSESIEQCI